MAAKISEVNKILALVGQVIALYRVSINREDHKYQIETFEETDDVAFYLHITFMNSYSFNWEFLEPLADLMDKKGVQWEVSYQDDRMKLSLYI